MVNRVIRSPLMVAVVAMWLLAALLGGTAGAAHDGGEGEGPVYSACRRIGGDIIKIHLDTEADRPCKPWQTVITWSAEGPQGPQGIQGIQGVPGEPGLDGADGAPGLDGADGAPGADGADGAPGLDGADGADGAPGLDGADGAPGLDGADGADGVLGTYTFGGLTNDVVTTSGWGFVGPTVSVSVGSGQEIVVSGSMTVNPNTTSTYPYQGYVCYSNGVSVTPGGTFGAAANTDEPQNLAWSMVYSLAPGTYDVGTCLFSNATGYDFLQVLSSGFALVVNSGP